MVKIYGFLRPVQGEDLAALMGSLALLDGDAGTVLDLSGELVNISYEGVFFPLDDFLKALAPLLERGCHGKIDYMDMEVWRLIRYTFKNGMIDRQERDLNSILDYSGH